jgi:hypothetical protein
MDDKEACTCTRSSLLSVLLLWKGSTQGDTAASARQGELFRRPGEQARVPQRDSGRRVACCSRGAVEIRPKLNSSLVRKPDGFEGVV